jgi:hypothetical protein
VSRFRINLNSVFAGEAQIPELFYTNPAGVGVYRLDRIKPNDWQTI